MQPRLKCVAGGLLRVFDGSKSGGYHSPVGRYRLVTSDLRADGGVMRSKAAIQTAHDQRLIVDELEIPDPQPDQVLVKLLSSGVWKDTFS